MVTIVSLIVLVVFCLVVGPWARRYGQAYRKHRDQSRGLDNHESNDL
jgi:hypothetical protein